MGKHSGNMYGVSTIITHAHSAWFGRSRSETDVMPRTDIETQILIQRSRTTNPVDSAIQRELDARRKTMVALQQEILQKLSQIQQEHQSLNRMLKRHGLPEEALSPIR